MFYSFGVKRRLIYFLLNFCLSFSWVENSCFSKGHSSACLWIRSLFFLRLVTLMIGACDQFQVIWLSGSQALCEKGQLMDAVYLSMTCSLLKQFLKKKIFHILKLKNYVCFYYFYLISSSFHSLTLISALYKRHYLLFYLLSNLLYLIGYWKCGVELILTFEAQTLITNWYFPSFFLLHLPLIQ
jgi:hypothetical protein